MSAVSGDAVQDQIEQYIRTRFEVDASDTHFGVEVNLWDAGYIDSMGVLEMLAFLEKEFGVKIEQEHLFDPEFTKIRGIASIVVGLMTA